MKCQTATASACELQEIARDNNKRLAPKPPGQPCHSPEVQHLGKRPTLCTQHRGRKAYKAGARLGMAHSRLAGSQRQGAIGSCRYGQKGYNESMLGLAQCALISSDCRHRHGDLCISVLLSAKQRWNCPWCPTFALLHEDRQGSADLNRVA